MRIDTSKYTYEALLAYAGHLGEQTFTAPHDRILRWMKDSWGLELSARTLSRHVQSMIRAGQVQVDYTPKGQAVYTFPDGVVTRQRLKEVPDPSSPGAFLFEGAEPELVSGEAGYQYEEPPGLRWLRFYGQAGNYAPEHVLEKTFFHHDSEPASSSPGCLHDGLLPF
jgi:hypothetical protein